MSAIEAMTDESANNVSKRVIGKPFQPGNTYGKKSKRGKAKLAQMFVNDLQNEWKDRGIQALNELNGKDLVQACIQILPKDMLIRMEDNRDQAKWVIDARPLSVEEWQRSHALPDTGNTPALESTTCDEKVQMSSKASSSDVDCVMVDAGYLVDSD